MIEIQVRTLARARTLTVLPRLDSRRKGTVVRFLYEANLIKRERVILDLWEADLSGADLIEATLRDADLAGANLHRADLYYANLMGADLREAYLNEAALNYANLTNKEVTPEQLEACRSLEKVPPCPTDRGTPKSKKHTSDKPVRALR
jgi:uncharacterized protein YjbI with pentapeptide repeats